MIQMTKKQLKKVERQAKLEGALMMLGYMLIYSLCLVGTTYMLIK